MRLKIQTQFSSMNRTPSCPTCRKQYVDVIKVYGQFQLRQEDVALTDELFKNITKLEDNISQLNGQITANKDKIKKMERERKQLLSVKERESKCLQSKLKELNNLVKTLKAEAKTKDGSPSAKLNAKNIELTKLNDDLLKQMDDLKDKLTAKANELDRCQRAAAQKNKTIKELKECESKCKVPEHKNFAKEMKINRDKIANASDLEHDLRTMTAAYLNSRMENSYFRFMYDDI